MTSSFFRPFAIIAILAAGPAYVTAAGPIPVAIVEQEKRAEHTVRRKQRHALADAPARYRRGKRAQAKPRRRPNRLHISKRVRRKHRRAA